MQKAFSFCVYARARVNMRRRRHCRHSLSSSLSFCPFFGPFPSARAHTQQKWMEKKEYFVCCSDVPCKCEDCKMNECGMSVLSCCHTLLVIKHWLHRTLFYAQQSHPCKMQTIFAHLPFYEHLPSWLCPSPLKFIRWMSCFTRFLDSKHKRPSFMFDTRRHTHTHTMACDRMANTFAVVEKVNKKRTFVFVSSLAKRRRLLQIASDVIARIHIGCAHWRLPRTHTHTLTRLDSTRQR